MCYYDQFQMGCGCFKWGNFRQHCTREYRTGDTCGMRLVMATYQSEEKCKLCTKIEIKQRRVQKEQERIKRWSKAGSYTASISSSSETIEQLEKELLELQCIKGERCRSLDAALLGTSLDHNDDTKTRGRTVVGDREGDKLRLPQVPVTDVLSVTRVWASVAEKSKAVGAVDASSADIERRPDEVDLRVPRIDDMLEDSGFSDTSSVHSVDSIFSNFTASTMSSVGAGPEADENLYILLTSDGLKVIYTRILHSLSSKSFERALRRSIVKMALDLRNEASEQREKRAAKVVKYRARNIAHLVAASIGSDRPRICEEVNAPGEWQISDSESNESGDDDSGDDSHIQALERFILQSNAFKDFKASLVDLIPPASEIKRLDELVEMTDMVEERALEEGLPWNKTVGISWKCSCGTIFEECVIEYKEGAAQKLADAIDTRASVDIERQAGSESCSESTASGSSGSSDGDCQRTPRGKSNASVEEKDQSIDGDATTRGEKLFILLCRDSGNETRLHHADVSKTLCDYSSYHVLHAQYYGRLKGFWKWLVLREISSIDFVKFHLYWATNVSIEHNDLGELPPYHSKDYSYTTDTNPPVPRKALLHFIEHPSHAPKQPHHRPRIPKKVGQPLLLGKALDACEGYGLYIQERICWRKVFAIEAVFATCCMIFAVVWCIRNRGGIQDGFAIADTGIAYATIILGASQAVAQNHWR